MKTKNDTEPPKPGRPKIVIDWGKVDGYLKAQCNGVEIAGILGVSPDTLYDKCVEDNKSLFSDYSTQKKAQGKEFLRAKQYATAMDGNVTMQIWLGKQYLEQRDKSELTGAGGKDLIPPRTLTKDEAVELWKDFENGKFPKVQQ